MTLTLTEVKARSASVLEGLHDVVRLAAEQLIERCYKRGVAIRITQGLRTMAEQTALYNQGRDSSGKIVNGKIVVTNAPAGYSYHNFGVAIDFVLIESGYDMQADKDGDGLSDWMEVVEVAKALGFAWGGDWKSFKDNPHFEMPFGLTTAQYRAGKKPSAAKLKAARAQIEAGMINKEDEEMTAAEKQAFTDLAKSVADLANSKDVLKQAVADQRETITAQAERIAKLEKAASMPCPEWAKEAVASAVAHGLVKDPDGGSYDFYRLLTVIHRSGRIN